MRLRILLLLLPVLEFDELLEELLEDFRLERLLDDPLEEPLEDPALDDRLMEDVKSLESDIK